MLAEAAGRLADLGAAILPHLLIALAVFGVGLLFAREVRAGDRRALALPEASADAASARRTITVSANVSGP